MIRAVAIVWFVLTVSPVLGAAPLAPAQLWEGVSEYRLGNGMGIIMAPDTSAGSIHFDLVYRTGSLADREGLSGTAHLLEHMMFKGIPQRTSEQLLMEMRERGISFNATTSFDRTRYSAMFEPDPAKLDYMLGLEAERMAGLRLSAADISNELQVVRQEIALTQDEPLAVLGESLLAVAWDGKAYGRPVLGAYDELDKITAQDLRQFHTLHYQPDNAVLVITGRFDPTEALDAVMSHFAAIESSPRSVAEPVAPPPARVRGVAEVRGGPADLVAIGYELPAASDERNAALAVLADVLAGEPHGRLYQALVVPGMAQGVFALQRLFQYGGQYLFGAVLAEEQSHQALQQALMEQIAGLREQPVSNTELARTQAGMRAVKASLINDPAVLSEILSESVALGDWQLQLRRFDEIEALDLQQVREQSEALFSGQEPVIGHLLAGDGSLAQGPRPLQRQPVAAAPPTTEQAPPASSAEMLDVEAFNAYVMTLEDSIQRGELSNGMKVALRAVPMASGMVLGSLNLRFGDLDNLHGKRAVADLVGTLLIRGSQSLSYQEIVDRANGLGAGFSVMPDGGVLAVRFASPQESLPELLALIAEVLQRPAFPPQEFELVKRQQLQGLRMPATAPASVAGLELSRQLEIYPSGDIRRHVEAQEMLAAVEAVTPDDVLHFHDSFYGAQHGELAISGDFDPQQVKQQLDTLFGSWMSKASYRHEPASNREVAAGRHQVETATAGGYYIGRLYFPAQGMSEEAAALFIVEYVLGRHPMASRLGKRLREQEQLTYDMRSSMEIPTVGNRAWLDIQGDFSAGTGERLADIIKEEVARMAESGITQQELNMARQSILSERRQYLGSDQNIQELLPEQLHEGVTMAAWVARNDAYAGMTLEQVNAVVSQYFKADGMVEILAGPDSGK